MNKKRYTAPSKLAAWMLMVAFLICSCVFGACTIAAALVGCYNQGLLSDTDAYQSGFCWNEARYYSYWADDWYNLSESNKLVTLSYSEQQRYEQLTEFLTRSSLIAERIDENNNGIVKQAILKPIPENAIKYAYFDEDDTGFILTPLPVLVIFLHSPHSFMTVGRRKDGNSLSFLWCLVRQRWLYGFSCCLQQDIAQMAQ